MNGTTSENPTIQLTRNQTYVFDVIALGNAFAIHTLPGVTTTAARFTVNATTGNLSNQGVITGLLSFTVPADAPNQLWYQSESNFAMFGRLDIIPFRSQPDTPPTLPPTSAPSSIFDWKPKCDPFLLQGELATTNLGVSTTFTLPATSGFGKRDTAPPSNPEIIFGSPVTDPPLGTTTRSSGATLPPGPESGSGRTYKCLTTTRAEQLMEMSLYFLALEGTNPSDLCNKPTDGPGIFAPLHTARWFMASAVSIFNGWAVYDRNANPIACNNPPPRRATVRQRTVANKEIAMTYSFFEVTVFAHGYFFFF